MTAPDWDQIEHDYRTERQPVRAIARRHGVSERTLRRHAEAGGWQRAEDAESIRSKHRRAVSRLNRLHDDLGDKAGTLVEAAASVRELADAAAAVERLGRIAERVITLERQVLGLDDLPAAEDDGLADALRKARERAGL